MSAQTNREKELFAEALELPHEERAAFLQRACGNDAELLNQVQGLLEAYSDDSPVLRATSDAVPGGASLSEGPGTKIGRYQLLEKIGEGGMGAVYMAEQTEPVRRRVALKIIKLGMDTRQVVLRFEAERQALAMMDHPNIARVLDGGTTETGRPYFVMELVRGIKITEYCDEQCLSTRERLELFLRVCEAVQHAHQKGVIHRDLKPSNILVTLNDGMAVPKVIDFGIAKAMQGRLTEQTLFTAFDHLLGTPAYMSPEQASMTRMDIDTRSDIYSLGVLLYELLTGQTPFDTHALLADGIDKFRQTICEAEPIRPSTRLRSLPDEELTSTARRRQVEVPKLLNRVSGDLDWIVMKCLEKDRRRRYQTANGLAMDIKRHLNQEPVVARSPSTAYRFQKLVQRNKLSFIAATIVAMTLVLGIVVSTGLALRATRAEREQNRLREAALKAGASEAVQRQLAGRERDAAIEQRQLADIQLALEVWEEGDLKRANELIEASCPAPGQSPGFEWRYLRRLCQDQSYETLGGSNLPYRSAMFLDRNMLLLNDGKTLTLHELSRRNEQLLLDDQEGIWTPALCSGKTNLLATLTDKGRIKVWDWVAGRVLVEFEGQSRRPPPSFGSSDENDTITFSHDGKWLASAISDGSVKLWDVEARSPKPARTIHRYASWTCGGIFSSDGNHLFSGGSEALIRVWDVRTGVEEGNPLKGHTSWVYTLAMSPDGFRLASGGADSTVMVWDMSTRELVKTLIGHIAMINVLAFSPDGQFIASAGRDHTIRLWDIKTGQQVLLLRGHGSRVNGLSYSPDGKLLVSRSSDGLVKLWKATPGQDGNVLANGRVSLEVAVSSDGRHLASVGADSSADLWDLSARKRLLLNGHTSTVMGAAFSPDGRMLATGSHDYTVRLWDVGNGKAIATLTNRFPVGSLAFSPDGKTLIVGGSKHHFLVGDQGGLQFWDVSSRQNSGTIPGDTSDIVQVAWSSSGSVLAMGHKGGPVSLWDPQSRRLLHRFESQCGSSVLSLVFSPTEPLLAVSDFGGNIVLYNIQTKEVIPPPLRAHSGRVTSLAFSPDGRTLASAGEGGGLKLWHVGRRQVALTLKGHIGVVKGVAFSQDGTFMASCGLDGTLRLWPAADFGEAGVKSAQAYP